MSVSESGLIKIRNFQYPHDYAGVYALWSQAGPGVQVRRSDQPEEIQKKLLRDPDLFLLAEIDGKLVGTVLGGFDGRRGMVYHLAVAPLYRRQGIGEALMNELERRLKEKGCIRFYLLVTQGNEDAIRFYEDQGWERMELHIFGKDIELGLTQFVKE
jgi:ribosomal protein S18 acetylase RimI-like enzyme